LGKVPGKCGERAVIMGGSLDSIFNGVVTMTAMRLSEFGFKRSGNTLRRILDESAAIVEFQRSGSNTDEMLSFTVNLAVVYGPLLDHDGVALKKARAIDGHLRQRIGGLLPTRQDKWWEIDAFTDVNSLAIEVSGLVSDVAVPYILQYVDPNELRALWETGQAPGLTEGARVRDLERLKHVLDKDQV
jgi:hypothetical protein